ncbi:MAG: response regulator transcription factor [Thermoanaerobaculia bacterium]
MRILVVEDEDSLAEALVEALEDEAYAVDLAADGITADELMSYSDYDLVVLDWTIPAPTGIELLRKWRGQAIATPVLMLTGRGDVGDRVDGLDTGADDYLTKPFSFVELLARVRSLLRRRSKDLETLQAGDLELERASRRVTVGGEVLDLPPKEFGILEYLLSRADETVSRTTAPPSRSACPAAGGPRPCCRRPRPPSRRLSAATKRSCWSTTTATSATPPGHCSRRWAIRSSPSLTASAPSPPSTATVCPTWS